MVNRLSGPLVAVALINFLKKKTEEIFKIYFCS